MIIPNFLLQKPRFSKTIEPVHILGFTGGANLGLSPLVLSCDNMLIAELLKLEVLMLRDVPNFENFKVERIVIPSSCILYKNLRKGQCGKFCGAILLLITKSSNRQKIISVPKEKTAITKSFPTYNLSLRAETTRVILGLILFRLLR